MFTKLSNTNYVPTPAEAIIMASVTETLKEPTWFYTALEKAHSACNHYSIKRDDKDLYLFFCYPNDLTVPTTVITTINKKKETQSNYAGIPTLNVSCSLLAEQLLIRIPLALQLIQDPTALSCIPTFLPIPTPRTRSARVYTDLVEATNSVKQKVAQIKKNLSTSTAVLVDVNAPIRTVPVKRTKRALATDAGKFNFASIQRPMTQARHK